MDHRHRFGYAFLAFALAQGLATLGTAVAGGSPLAVGLDLLLGGCFAAIGIAYLTGRAGTDVESRSRWMLRYGPPIVVIFAVVIAMVGLTTILGA